MRAYVKLMTAGSLVFLTISPSLGESIEQKLCIFAATQKLPNLPGITVTGSRAKVGPVASEVARTFAANFANLSGVAELNRLGLLSAAQNRGVQSSLAQGSPERAAGAIATAITDQITNSSSVEIDIRAAGQPATFAFLCAEIGGSPLVVSQGMSQ